MTRGQRNNNPLNIRKGSQWKGLVRTPEEKHFCVFSSMLYGIRAALVLLRTYKYRYHCVTISQIISRWAPPSENDTNKYIDMVVSLMLSQIPSSDVYHNELVNNRGDVVVNIWFNKTFPHSILYYLLSAMAIVESNYFINRAEFDVAVGIL